MLSSLDDGTPVVVGGVVVESWSSDSGSRSIILADIEAGSTVRVTYMLDASSRDLELHIGDEVCASGQLEVSGGSPVIWSQPSQVLVTKESQEVVTVSLISRAWDLFVDDRFHTRGVLTTTSGDTYRLMDAHGGTSIALVLGLADASRYAQKTVVVDATLRLDSETMSFFLEVHSISL